MAEKDLTNRTQGALTSNIEDKIVLLRGQKILLDSDLAQLYNVETKVLIQAVKRNIDRFPLDFMFQLSKEEHDRLRSQSVTSNGRGGRRYPPYVFTEQGVAMLSSVLRSKTAIGVNIEIMRTFVRLRQMISANKELDLKLEALEDRYDKQFEAVFQAIRDLMAPAKPLKNPIGYIWDDDQS